MPRKRNPPPSEDVDIPNILKPKIEETAAYFQMSCFASWEPTWLWLQRSLTFEKPQVTVLLFLPVLLVYWLAATLQFYQFVGVFGVLSCSAQLLIPLFFKPGDATESEQNDDLVPFDKLCHFLAVGYVYGKHVAYLTAVLRLHAPFKFFIAALVFFSLIGIIGQVISFLDLLAFVVICLMLVPAWHHWQIMDRLLNIMHPTIREWEKKMNIKRTKRVKRHVHDDSDDDILDEFVPQPPQVKISSVDSGVPESLPSERDDESLVLPSLSQLDGSLDFTDDEHFGLPSEMPSLMDSSLTESGNLQDHPDPIPKTDSGKMFSSTEEGFVLVNPDKELL